MRSFTIFIMMWLLMINTHICGQEFPLDDKTARIHYSEVVELNKVSSKELFSRAQLYFHSKFKKNRVEQEDSINLLISEKGGFILPVKVMGIYGEYNVIYTLTVRIKNGRYKYDIDEFYILTGSSEETGITLISFYNRPSKKIKKAIDETLKKEMDQIIRELKSTMQDGEFITKEDDW